MCNKGVIYSLQLVHSHKARNKHLSWFAKYFDPKLTPYQSRYFSSQIDIDETRKFVGEFTQCGWDVPKAENVALVSYYRFAAFPLINMEINVKHIKCVTFAIGSALFASELAKDWLIFHIQLIRSASTIYACKKLGKFAKYM